MQELQQDAVQHENNTRFISEYAQLQSENVSDVGGGGGVLIIASTLELPVHQPSVNVNVIYAQLESENVSESGCFQILRRYSLTRLSRQCSDRDRNDEMDG